MVQMKSTVLLGVVCRDYTVGSGASKFLFVAVIILKLLMFDILNTFESCVMCVVNLYFYTWNLYYNTVQAMENCKGYLIGLHIIYVESMCLLF